MNESYGSPVAPSVLATPVYADVELSFLIEQTRLEQPRAERRLNALENTLAALVHHWRPQLPIAPACDLRMSDATGEAYMAWVEEKEAASGQHTLARLSVYASGAVTDDSVPEGLVRVLLHAAGRTSGRRTGAPAAERVLARASSFASGAVPH